MDAMLLVCQMTITMIGMLPVMELVSRLLKTPLTWIGNCIGLDVISISGLLFTLVSCAPVFPMMKRMNTKRTNYKRHMGNSCSCCIWKSTRSCHECMSRSAPCPSLPESLPPVSQALLQFCFFLKGTGNVNYKKTDRNIYYFGYFCGHSAFFLC